MIVELGFTREEEAFRSEAAAWLEEQLSGPFAAIRHIDSHIEQFELRQRWEQALGAARWSCIGWPAEYGGRDATLAEQVIFAEEYTRLGAPGRIGHNGIELFGPTLIAFGSETQKQRFLPDIAQGRTLWAQGYSEPNAGSDLSNVRTKARLEQGPNGAEWVIDGQKIWTSGGQFADWGFVVCRTEEGSRGSKGLSYLLVPMRQPGVTVRPINTLVNEATFSEVFFDGARTAADNVVGTVGEGWKVAMGTLAFERGASSLAQQMAFRRELLALVEAARANGLAQNASIRERIAEAYVGLKIMRFNALRMLSNAQAGRLSPEAFTYKIYWASWHRRLGELAMDVLGAAGELIDGDEYALHGLQKMFLYSRADTIYAGTNQIQRNIIAERALGLPREPRNH
jgi:alkylation response protein AidB-like acyl-CoA dehydrogenase